MTFKTVCKVLNYALLPIIKVMNILKIVCHVTQHTLGLEVGAFLWSFGLFCFDRGS